MQVLEVEPGIEAPRLVRVVGTKGSTRDIPVFKDQLVVTVVAARGLQRERTITDPRGVCDPKVRCSLVGETGETQVSTTRTEHATLSPLWEEHFTFAIDGRAASQEKLCFTLLDDDYTRDVEQARGAAPLACYVLNRLPARRQSAYAELGRRAAGAFRSARGGRA